MDKGGLITGCIAAMVVAGSYAWRHAWRIPILKALMPGGILQCIGFLIYFFTGTVSRFMRGWSWIYVYHCMLELAA